MILRNVSAKIINVGSKILMPDKEIVITEEEAGLPSVKALEELHLIYMVEEPKAAKVEEAEAVEEKPVVKRTRKTTAE